MGFDINTFRRQIFSGSFLSDEEVIATVGLMDRHINAAVSASLNLKPVRVALASIAAHVLHGRNRNTRTLNTSATRAERVTAGSDFTADEIAFLSAYTALESDATVPLADFRLFRRTRVEILLHVLPAVSLYLESTRASALSVLTGSSVDTQAGRLYEIESSMAMPAGSSVYRTFTEIEYHWREYLKHRNELCEPYLRKVWSVVCSTISQDDGRFLELFNWGVTGLFVAAECFDATRKSSFGRFAENWIHQRVLSYMKNAMNTITQPPAAIQLRTSVRTAIRNHGLGHLDVDRLAATLSEILKTPVNTIMIAMAEDRSFSGLVNLGTTIGEDDSKTTIGDTVADRTLSGSESDATDVIAMLDVARKVLSDEDFKLLRVHTGLEHVLLSGEDVLVPAVVDAAMQARHQR